VKELEDMEKNLSKDLSKIKEDNKKKNTIYRYLYKAYLLGFSVAMKFSNKN
jgi:hypothetical protein